MSRRRERARAFGMTAETVATLWLRAKFYRILARNFAAAGGEIDVIAMRGATIAFVEVKARPTLDAASIAIDPVKQRRLSRAVRAWVAVNGWAAGRTLRGDAVFVAPWRAPRHVEAAVPLDIFA